MEVIYFETKGNFFTILKEDNKFIYIKKGFYVLSENLGAIKEYLKTGSVCGITLGKFGSAKCLIKQ